MLNKIWQFCLSSGTGVVCGLLVFFKLFLENKRPKQFVFFMILVFFRRGEGEKEAEILP